MLSEDDVLQILERHGFDTSLDWRDPEIGFSSDELLAMAEWVQVVDGGPPTIEDLPLYHAADLHVNRLPDWIKQEVHD